MWHGLATQAGFRLLQFAPQAVPTHVVQWHGQLGPNLFSGVTMRLKLLSGADDATQLCALSVFGNMALRLKLFSI